MGREARLSRRPKVVVGYPVGGSVTLGFHASMLKLLGYEIAKPAHKRLLGKITHTQGLYVADNRTMLVQRFLEMDADWLLQIDTDIEFPPTLVESMLELAEGRQILAASVPLGTDPTCAYFRSDEPGVFTCAQRLPLMPIEVDGLATAVCLVHREVFEKIADAHGQCWFHHIYLPESAPGTPLREFKYRSQGEDLAFSVRAAREGFKLWVVHLPGLKHHKTRGLSHDDERASFLATADSGVGEIVPEGEDALVG